MSTEKLRLQLTYSAFLLQYWISWIPIIDRHNRYFYYVDCSITNLLYACGASNWPFKALRYITYGFSRCKFHILVRALACESCKARSYCVPCPYTITMDERQSF